MYVLINVKVILDYFSHELGCIPIDINSLIEIGLLHLLENDVCYYQKISIIDQITLTDYDFRAPL